MTRVYRPSRAIACSIPSACVPRSRPRIASATSCSPRRSTNARDLARFGLLYLQDGVWEGERLLSEEWIDFVRTPAPATAERGKFYGGQFWLVPDDRDDVPKDAYATAGNRGQYVIVDPSHDLVIVRRGLDHGRQGFDRWDLLREVLKAFLAPNLNS